MSVCNTKISQARCLSEVPLIMMKICRNATTAVEDSHLVPSTSSNAGLDSIPDFEQHFRQDDMPVIEVVRLSGASILPKCKTMSGFSSLMLPCILKTAHNKKQDI